MSGRAIKACEVAALWEANADSWARQTRNGADVFRDRLNTPAFLAMLPPVRGLRGLDVGCGEGFNTRRLAASGALMWALDIAPSFVRWAQQAERDEPLGIEYRRGDAMRLPYATASFDFVTAFMSLMDLPDPARALREAARVLRPGAFVQFSILHPCFMTPERQVLRDAERRPYALQLGGYFGSTAGRVDRWWFTSLGDAERAAVEPFNTPIFHRPLAAWLNMVIEAGLAIEQLCEPTLGALAGGAKGEDVLAESRIAPLSLVVRARKPVMFDHDV